MEHVVVAHEKKNSAMQRRVLALAGLGSCLVFGALGLLLLPKLWQALSFGGTAVIAALYFALMGIGNEFQYMNRTTPRR